jgi:hypothetical protein
MYIHIIYIYNIIIIYNKSAKWEASNQEGWGLSRNLRGLGRFQSIMGMASRVPNGANIALGSPRFLKWTFVARTISKWLQLYFNLGCHGNTPIKTSPPFQPNKFCTSRGHAATPWRESPWGDIAKTELKASYRAQNGLTGCTGPLMCPLEQNGRRALSAPSSFNSTGWSGWVKRC